MGRYCLLASGSVVAGQVKIQDEVIWTGAVITPRLTTYGSIVGAGATVFSDVNTTVAKPPEKVLKIEDKACPAKNN